ILKRTGKPLSELAGEMQAYPQRLVNVKVKDKHLVMENERIKQTIEHVEQKLGQNGRVLVRPSGTEPLVRVMVEAENAEECERYVQEIADVVQAEMGME